MPSTQQSVSQQAKSIIGASEKRVTSRKLAELIYCLINDLPLKIDMGVVETTTLQVLKNNHIPFKGSLELFEELPETDQQGFDGAVEYFFEGVCKPGITVDQIESLIKICIKI
jgi:hypothetical protein